MTPSALAAPAPYPVVGRDDLLNKRIACHESGHAIVHAKLWRPRRIAVDYSGWPIRRTLRSARCAVIAQPAR